MKVTLTGANQLARHQELQALTTAFIADHGDTAVERYDGEETTTERMRESIASLPFLSGRKLVILREPSRQKAFAENIADILEAMAETTDLIIHEPKLDKRLGYYKTLKKSTDFREFPELDASGLAKWAVSYAAQRHATLAAADARILIDRVGGNQQLIKSEIDKLASYDPQITRHTIELLTERLPQSTVFELLDAAFTGNVTHLFRLYQEQRALRVEPQAIIAMLAWQMHILAVVKMGLAAKKSADDIAKQAKINPFVVRKTQPIARKLTTTQVKSLTTALLTLDEQLKRSSVDADEALQNYLLFLASPSEPTT